MVGIYKEKKKKLMAGRRRGGIKKIQALSRSDYSESFASMLIYCYFEGLPEAEKITEELNLDPIDLYAIDQDFNRFETLLIKEKEREDEQRFG